jgi:Icc-related predicted phosphoesterase
LSHAPPRDGKLDRTFFGKHVGSTALKQFIDERQPDVVICGHIHEGRGKLTMGRTAIVNCGYGARRYYVLVEIDGEIHIELRRA